MTGGGGVGDVCNGMTSTATQWPRGSRVVDYALDVVGKLIAGANSQAFEFAMLKHMLLERMATSNLLPRELSSKPSCVRKAARLAYPLCNKEPKAASWPLPMTQAVRRRPDGRKREDHDRYRLQREYRAARIATNVRRGHPPSTRPSTPQVRSPICLNGRVLFRRSRQALDHPERLKANPSPARS